MAVNTSNYNSTFMINANTSTNINSSQFIINSNYSNNDSNNLLDKCEHLSATELIYHSSEQYLILCLKLCSSIIRDKCDIGELVDFNRYRLKLAAFKSSATKQLTSINSLKQNLFYDDYLDIKSSSLDTSNNNNYSFINYSPLLLSHLNETECMKYAHRESYKLSLFICGIILCLIILILNSLTLITIIKSKRLHNITNILIANLSLSDFLSGIAFLYPCILNLLTIYALEAYDSHLYKITCNVRQFYYLCLAGYSPLITSMLSSIFTLTLLAIEKYMAILHPYLYERLIDDRKYLCYIVLILTWTISIIISMLPLMGWNEHNKYSSYRGFDCQDAQSLPCMFERIFTLDYILLFTIICCICALTMLAIYVRIYMIARRHSKQIANVKIVLNHKNNNSNINGSNHEDPINERCQNDHNEMITMNTNLNRIDNNDDNCESIEGVVKAKTINMIKKSNSKQDNKILANSLSNVDNINSNNGDIINSCDVAASTTKSLNKGMKAMKTLLILLLGFYLCWLPLIIYFLTFAGQNYKNSTIYILMFVACCNAVIDPLVYAFRNKDFCKALLLNFKFRNQ